MSTRISMPSESNNTRLIALTYCTSCWQQQVKFSKDVKPDQHIYYTKIVSKIKIFFLKSLFCVLSHFLYKIRKNCINNSVLNLLCAIFHQIMVLPGQWLRMTNYFILQKTRSPSCQESLLKNIYEQLKHTWHKTTIQATKTSLFDIKAKVPTTEPTFCYMRCGH